MPRTFDPEDDNQNDFEYDTGGDWPEDEDDGYVPCPYCGATMLEAADYCPTCDRWMTNEQEPSKTRSWWIVAVVILLVAMMLWSAIGF